MIFQKFHVFLTTCKQNDIICLSQTVLDSSIKIANNRLNIESGKNRLRIDLLGAYFSGNNKRRGLCIYYKDHLPAIRRDDLCILQECLPTEIQVRRKMLLFHMPL